MRSPVLHVALLLGLLAPGPGRSAVFGSLRGVVHDPDHRPVPGAQVVIKASASDFIRSLACGADGAFEALSLPPGRYRVTASADGLAAVAKDVMVVSGSAPVLHFQLALGAGRDSITVSESVAPSDSVTPTTVLSRKQIETTPGAGLTNSLSLITDYVPGAWVTHDQLHIRGGHQVTWAIDGVPIPNTNIASNAGPQIDPKDVDYLEVHRGGYSADLGDRTYGVFNVVPRTGFERNNEGELLTTFGSFHQTNDQVNFGSHTERFAYYAGVNGNRSEYGLQTPGPDVLHDRVWGLGGMATLIYNRDAGNQLRFVSSLRRDDYQIPDDPEAYASGVRDMERERDAALSFSWAHSFSPGVLLAVSPFYHYNRANYDGAPGDAPVSTTQHRVSQYAGAQVALSAVTSRHNARAGVYGFGQSDDESVALTANDGSGGSVAQRQIATGHLEALFFEDQYKLGSWLTLTAGVRMTHFTGAVAEDAANPRLGAAVRIPRLNWVFRGFWGTYYQAPPLATVSGPLLDYAVGQGLGFIPLHGERDQEHQFGVTIPIRSWSVEVNNYHQRARNYFDHNAIGNSNIFFPLTIAGGRFYGWEVAVRSPRLLHRGEVTLAYSNARALAAGAVSGGLTDFAPPESGYFLLDHDQRHTLHTGFQFDLPGRLTAGGNVYYGSGFTDGVSAVPTHLPGHTTADLTLGRSFGERLTVSITALNAANRRFLLDNSETFGGTHYADPRQIYVQVRYRFHY